MPLYNKAQEVCRAIQSVLNQSVADFELIVVNDGSTDNGPEIVRRYSDPRIRVFDQENAGVSEARNTGIRKAGAELVAFLDADDEWLPDFLETIFSLKKRYPDCEVFGTSYYFKRPEANLRAAVIGGLPSEFNEGLLPHYFHIAVQSDPPLCSSAVAVNKTAIVAIGGFPGGIATGEDLLTWARLAVSYKIAYCKEPKAVFWAPTHIYARKRVPQTPDIVGGELALLADTTDIQSLNAYVTLWHRMRANIYFQLGDRASAAEECRIGLRYNARDWKLLVFYLLTKLPQPLSVSLFRQLKRIYESRKTAI
jgi:glycosyltransferase involved in cell wall biosynthesis